MIKREAFEILTKFAACELGYNGFCDYCSFDENKDCKSCAFIYDNDELKEAVAVGYSNILKNDAKKQSKEDL